MDRLKRYLGMALAIALIFSLGPSADSRDREKASLVRQGFSDRPVTMPAAALLAAAGAKGSPAYHRHLARPGAMTSYLLRVQNLEATAVTVELSVTNVPPHWTAGLQEDKVKLEPGAKKYLQLELKPFADLPAGSVAAVTV